MAVATESFQRRNWNPYRLTFGTAAVFFLLSLLLHSSILMLASRQKLLSDPEKVDVSAVDVRLLRAPALDTLQETAKEKPKDAKFESSRNLKADEDTSPELAPTSLAQKSGKAESERARAAAAAKRAESSSKIMSITQEDMLAKGELQKETLRGNGGSLDSSGFFEKLKRGAELKISALESDYGQYITRMKRKIAQQWNPQRTVTAQMYKFNEVRVDIAVVLNDQGEIVDLRMINSSFFPEYDAETRRAVRDASPFPNPPKSLIQPENNLIYMPWTFTVFMNQAGSYHVE